MKTILFIILLIIAVPHHVDAGSRADEIRRASYRNMAIREAQGAVVLCKAGYEFIITPSGYAVQIIRSGTTSNKPQPVACKNEGGFK